MLVPVVQIRIMRMLVPQSIMTMPMRMRFGDRFAMDMLRMRIVQMRMIMLQHRMKMLVIVPFRQMQPEAGSHQQPGEDQLHRDRIVENQHGQHRANEWRQREIRSRSRRSQMPQAEHEHD